MDKKITEISEVIIDSFLDRNEALKRSNMDALKSADEEIRNNASKLAKLVIDLKVSEFFDSANEIFEHLQRIDKYIKKDMIDSFMKEDEAVRKIVFEMIDTIFKDEE